MPTYSLRTAITMWMSCGDDVAPAPAPAPPLPLPPVDVACSQTHNGLIFVSVVSFRDAECQWTLHNLFHTATDPRRLRVGVVWQVRAAAPCIRFLTVLRLRIAPGRVLRSARPPAFLSTLPASSGGLGGGRGVRADGGRRAVRALRTADPHRLARGHRVCAPSKHMLPVFLPPSSCCSRLRPSPPGRGSTTSRAPSRRPCKARQLAQSLWDGEEFYLQLDAHMRFAPGWDAQLTTWLAAAEITSPKAVLSTYPGG